MLFGLARVDNRKKQYKVALSHAVHAFLSAVQVLEPNEKFAQTYALVRADLVSKGQDIGVMDTMIAAQAIAHGFTLVTHNTRHFERIGSSLKLVDWLSK